MKQTLQWLESIGVERFINDKYHGASTFKNKSELKIVTKSHKKNPLETIKTLDELEMYIKNLSHPLKETATNTVFGCGNRKSKILFIGEAPGQEEDAQGIPFVGQSGQLLTNIMLSIKMPREKIYITNVVNWRPANNRTPSTDEITFFKPILFKHIELLNPSIIVTLGATATKAVLEINTGILSIRGQWLEKEIHGKNYLVLPTYHPSYLLRSSSQKKTVWIDFLNLSLKMKKLGISVN